MDASSISRQQAAGLQPTYGTIWIGKWNLEKGWKDPDRLLAEMRKANVTPAIHLYYWAEDLSPSCIEDGCNGKSREQWRLLAQQLGEHLEKGLRGDAAMVILESEFNKAHVARYAPLDGYLADMAHVMRGAYPAASIVLAFGNWNRDAWVTWHRAADASDSLGLQAMSSAPRHGPDRLLGLYNETLKGIVRLKELFDKPIVIVDLALSSFPEPDNLATQAQAVSLFLASPQQLRDLGVVALLYRSFADSPGMGLDHYFGAGERHWGIAWSNGTLKPAGAAWVDTQGLGLARPAIASGVDGSARLVETSHEDGSQGVRGSQIAGPARESVA